MEGSRGIARTRARLAQESECCSNASCGADASCTTWLRAGLIEAAVCRGAPHSRIIANEIRTRSTPISLDGAGASHAARSRDILCGRQHMNTLHVSGARVRERCETSTCAAREFTRSIRHAVPFVNCFPDHQPIGHPNVFQKNGGCDAT